MGKISDALKKINDERSKASEILRQSVINRLNRKADEAKAVEESLPNKYDLGGLRLRERIETFTRETMYIAKTTDRTGIDPRIVTHYDYSSPISEQYRILRTNIKSFMPRNGKFSKSLAARSISSPKVVALTSSVHNEGKTVTATNLAVALAKDKDCKVLLIDADLRNGTTHKLLNVNHTPGLSEILQSDLDYSVSLLPTPIENLFLIPRGTSSTDSAELLGSKKMRLVLEQLKKEALDYIIIDTPPIIPFTDAAVLAPQVDANLLIVQAHRTQAPTVQRAKRLIGHAQGKLLGFVLTQSEQYTPDFYTYYYYHQFRNTQKEQQS